MAEAPDARSFKSWQDAFAYPVPTVRTFESHLRSHINDSKDKIRSLVGSSYRDLLGTADRIITMNEDMQKLEDVINNIGQKCNNRLLNRVGSNFDQLSRHQRDSSMVKRRAAAQVALMHPCLSVCQQVVRDPDGNLLLAARLALLSRLLQQSVAKSAPSGHDHKAYRVKIDAQRLRLLSKIERRVAGSDIPRAQILDLLLAHALVTSSSLADTARHFLRARQSAIKSTLDQPRSDDQPKRITTSMKTRILLSSLTLLFSTLGQSHAVFPIRMAENMSRATGPRLLQDETLRNILALDLDIYERWISPDVQSYTAWLRRDDLDTESLSAMLTKWIAEEFTTIEEGLKAALATTRSTAAAAKMREAVLSHILTADAVVGAHDQSLIETVRLLFADRLRAIITTRIYSIRTSIQKALEANAPSNPPGNLWDSSLGETDLAHGAVAFQEELASRIRGQDDRLQRLEDAISRWIEVVEGIEATIKGMRHTRWKEEEEEGEDDYVDDNDEVGDDDPDRKTVEQGTIVWQKQQKARIQSELGRQDPDALAQHVQSETDGALGGCLTLLEEELNHLSATGTPSALTADNAVHSKARAVYLVRVLRIVAQSLRSSPSEDSQTAYTTTKARIALLGSNLHALVAVSIASELSLQYKIDTAAFNAPRKGSTDGGGGVRPLFHRGQTVATSLWQGSPPLPVQPSPGTFRFIRDAARLMDSMGGDVWSVLAVDAVKVRLGELIARGMERALPAGLGNDAENGRDRSTLLDQTEMGKPEGKAESTSEGTGQVDEGFTPVDVAPGTVEGDASAGHDGTGKEDGKDKEQDDRQEGSPETGTREWLLQVLFDLLYLAEILSSSTSTTASEDKKGEGAAGGVAAAIAQVMGKLTLENADVERLGKNASTYHRRSYLLFGVLCPPS